MNDKIIITGSNGYLGGKIIKCILESTDYRIVGLTRSLDLPLRMLEREGLRVSDRIQFITNDEFLGSDTKIDEIYGAVHLAFSRRMKSAKDIASSIDFGAAIFHKLVELGADRVINMSSQGIYGNSEDIRNENTPPSPETQYTMAKYAAEVLFSEIMLNVPHHTSLRLDSVVQSQNVVKGLCQSAKEGLIQLKGGKQVFSFIDAEDVGKAVVAMLEAKGEWDKVYNVGWNNKRYTLTELALIVADAAELCGYKRPKIELIEADVALWAGMDSSRFISKTGWEPIIELQESIEDYIKSV